MGTIGGMGGEDSAALRLASFAISAGVARLMRVVATMRPKPSGEGW